ncbi:MAG: GH3 auxin-responsive promoter family protein [Rariglobus sp.]
MLSPTKTLLNVGVSFLTTRTARRLRDGRDAVPAQARTLKHLLSQLTLTAYGHLHSLTPATTYSQFQARAPLQTYEGYMPWIERMMLGEPNVLWPGYCSFYATSSGTTENRTKYLPVTDAMLEHFRKAGLESLVYYTARVGHTGVFRGKNHFLGGSTTLSRLEESKDRVAYAGDLSGISAVNLPNWVEKHLYEPGAAISQISDWPAKIQAIAERTWNRDVTLLAGIPNWILILADAVKSRAASGKSRPSHLQGVWPNLECLVHGGIPITPFIDELRNQIGPKVNFHEVYPASEGFIAAQDAESAQGMRLMTDVGIFYEFLPMRDYNPANLAQLGQRTVPLEEVRTGVDYALIITTPSGLTRYVIGDVVRFISTDIPRIVYVGRTSLQLAAFGERVVEKELTDALYSVCQRHGWTIANFHVAPLPNERTPGVRHGRHEWWVELKPYTTETPTGPVIAAELDVELKRLNDDYESKRNHGIIEDPHVRLVMPGVFEHWMRSNGRWGGQHKMPRCRNDREIATELAQVARFSNEA